MKKAELAEAIMRASGLTKANVNNFYKGLVDVVRKELLNKNESVLPGLGVLRARTRKAREGRNPRTGEKIHISRRKVVRFKMYKDLKYSLNPHLAKEKESEPPEAPPAEGPEETR